MLNALRLLTALAWMAASIQAHAQGYPAKPVRLVLPFSAGGGQDAFVRALGHRMSEDWGQTVQVDNRPGANGIIGTEHVVRSAPDGYTLLVSDPGLVNNSSLYSKLPYDPLRDLAPVSGLLTNTYGLAVHASVPAGNLKELIALAKAKPGELSYATFGTGSTVHLAMEMLQVMAGIKLNHIPYKGTAPALVDVSAGRVEVMLTTVSSILPYWKTGKMKMLAVGTAKRATQYPEVPTIAEAGLPGYAASAWWGLHAPAGTPREIIEKVNADVRKIVADPSFREKNLDPQGFEPLLVSPDQFSAFIKTEASIWGKIARDAKVKLD